MMMPVLPLLFHLVFCPLSYIIFRLMIFLLVFNWQKGRFSVAKKGKYRHNNIRPF